MASPGKKVGQDLAIAAMLSDADVATTARQAGVSIRTMSRWMADEDFKRRLSSARWLMIGRATNKLSSVTLKAVLTLESIMNNEKSSPGVRARCAIAILQAAFESQVTELNDLHDQLQEILGKHGRRR